MKNKNSRQGSLFEEQSHPITGKGVGKIGQDQDKVFNQSKNSFWWQDEVKKQNESKAPQNQSKAVPNLFETDLDQTQSVASSIMARNVQDKASNKSKGPNRMPSLFNDQGAQENPSIISNAPIADPVEDQYDDGPQIKKQEFKSKIQATLQAQMMGGATQQVRKSDIRQEVQQNQAQDQSNIIMSKPTRKAKKNDRLPSQMMFDESDVQKQREQFQAQPQASSKQLPISNFAKQQQKTLKKPFKKANNAQLFDSFNSTSSKQVPQEDIFQTNYSQQQMQYTDPFGISNPIAQKKPAKGNNKKAKFFFDQTDNESMDESVRDYYPAQPKGKKQQAPTKKNQMFTQDQAIQQRAAQSNINLFADSFVSEAPTQQFMLPSQKKKVDKKVKSKNGQKSGGFDLFGGGVRDDDYSEDASSVSKKQPSVKKQAQTQKAVAKRLENLFDDDFDDEY